jgi:triosephosphate isomerase
MKRGAFTGEISEYVKSVGVNIVILGHSEHERF